MGSPERSWSGSVLGRPALHIRRRIPPIRRRMAHAARRSPSRPINRRRFEERRARPVNAREGTFSSRVQTLSALLTPRRIRTHALILALCLWGVCALDYARPRLLDRAGNVRFHDFLPLYVSAQM